LAGAAFGRKCNAHSEEPACLCPAVQQSCILVISNSPLKRISEFPTDRFFLMNQAQQVNA